MTVIATAAVKVTADTRDLKQNLDDGSAAIKNFGRAHSEVIRAADGHALSLGRVERALGSFVGHMSGAPPVVENVAQALGQFAVGSTLLTGVLSGLAALGAAWFELTKSAREAAKAQDEAIRSAQGAIHLRALGAGGAAAGEIGGIEGRLQILRDQRAGLLRDLSGPLAGTSYMIGKGSSLSDLDEDIANLSAQLVLSKKIMAEGINEKNAATLGEAQRKLAEALAKHEAAERKAIEDRARYDKDMREIYDFSHGASRSPLLTPLQSSADIRGQNALAGFQKTYRQYSDPSVDIPSINMPSVGVNDGLTKEGIKQREKLGILIDTSKQGTEILKSTIEASSAIIASAIISSLNVGGGRGGAIGGALGGAIGFGVGTYAGAKISGLLGSVVPGVGTVVGTLLGSAIGGLFHHHKKSIDNNTQAINALTAALFNAPSGYKVAGARYRADDGRRIYEATSQETNYRRQRGGVGNMGMAA